MTSISSSMSMGRHRMDALIQQAESNGTISSTDQTAFETALDNIDTSLSSTSSSTSPDSASGTDMKDKINGLIQDQVSAGTLTSDQASELQSLFAQGPGGPPPQLSASDGSSDAASTGSAQGITGMQAIGQTGGMQGPPPPPPPSDSSSVDNGSAGSSASSSTAELASTNGGGSDANSTSASSGIDEKQLDAFIFLPGKSSFEHELHIRRQCQHFGIERGPRRRRLCMTRTGPGGSRVTRRSCAKDLGFRNGPGFGLPAA